MKSSIPLIKQGWLRAFIFLIVWVLIQAGLSNLIYTLAKPLTENGNHQTDPALNLLFISLISFGTSIPAVWVFRKLIDRKSIVSLGFTWKGYERYAWSGFFGGVFIMAAGALLLLAARNLKFIAFDFSPKDLMLYVLVMIVVAVAEESVIRGYILNNLLESFPKWIALLISATLFALFHFLNPAFNWLSMLGIFLGGLLLGINYVYTKNLWFGIFMHFSWNFFQGPVLGFKVSGLDTNSLLVQDINGPAWWTGGSFGFEASLLACLLIFAVTVYFFFSYKRNNLSLATA